MLRISEKVRRGFKAWSMNPSAATYDNAVRILSETMRPWRAAKLHREAFVPVPGKSTFGEGRQDERFRERLAVRRPQVIKRGPFFALGRWFNTALPIVTRDDFIKVPLNGKSLKLATEETFNRLPHMVTRNPSANPVIRNMACAQGLWVQHHVTDFFQHNWPTSYVPASNEGLYKRPAPDDFGLNIEGRIYLVDVAQSENLDPPRWRLRSEKMRGADMQIVAYFDSRDVIIQGYTWKNHSDLWPIERLIVRLNIQEIPDCLLYFDEFRLFRR